jgi:hypothetical protein
VSKFIKVAVITAILTVLISSISAMPQQASAKTSPSDVSGAYYKVVSDIINEYGIGTEDFTAGGAGLAYAELIDFDKNGVSELFLIYSGGSYDYTLEVWGYGNNKASLIYSTSDQNRGLVGDLKVSLLTTKTAAYINYTSTYSSGRGDEPYENQYFEDHSIWALADNKFTETVSLGYLTEESSEGDNQRVTYTLKEKNEEQKISSEIYDQWLGKYEIAKGKTIIGSSAGSKAYHFDISNNKKTIDNFVKKLKSGLSPETLAKINKQLKKPTIQIEKAYDSIDSFHEGVALVRKDSEYGFIDKAGKEIVKLQYDYAEGYSGGLAVVKKDKKFGFIDKKGKLVVKAKYEYAFSFSNGLASVYGNGGWGFIDKTGKEVIKLQYQSPYNNSVDGYGFNEGLAAVKKDGMWGFIDTKGKTVLKFQYEGASNFYKGAANVRINGEWKYINKKGKPVAAPVYDSTPTSSLSEGMELVNIGDYWGFVDKAGKEVIKPRYDSASAFSEGMAVVQKNDRWMLIPNPLVSGSK